MGKQTRRRRKEAEHQDDQDDQDGAHPSVSTRTRTASVWLTGGMVWHVVSCSSVNLRPSCAEIPAADALLVSSCLQSLCGVQQPSLSLRCVHCQQPPLHISTNTSQTPRLCHSPYPPQATFLQKLDVHMFNPWFWHVVSHVAQRYNVPWSSCPSRNALNRSSNPSNLAATWSIPARFACWLASISFVFTIVWFSAPCVQLKRVR